MILMSNMYDFSSVFFLSLATMTFGFCAGALGYALKSKCNNVKLCYGCLEIERDVELEADIEENQQQQQQPPVQQIDNIPNSQQSSRRSSIQQQRRSHNLTADAINAVNAINALNNNSTKEETKEIDFRKSMI